MLCFSNAQYALKYHAEGPIALKKTHFFLGFAKFARALKSNNIGLVWFMRI